ncbi:MAG: hypothetical protein KGZ40_02160 [Clostridiales bacterium]|nr:hypothetical protein [Clostridiales bacterium]
MVTRIAIAAVLVSIVMIGGCGRENAPSVTQPSGSTQAVDPPGLYEIDETTVRAVGILDRVELEGGFWAVTGVASSDGAESTVIAVIANADTIESELANLRGFYVEVTGRRFDGVSIRMAGPEIIADEVRALEGVIEGDAE